MSREFTVPLLTETYDVAAIAHRIFMAHGLETCLFGSTACTLFGMSRTPNDVDLIVLTRDHQQEQLKQLLVNAHSAFYLLPSRDPEATYRVLWYRLGGYRRRLKVDILLPGILDIPDVPPSSIKWMRGLPAMPLMPLLMLKLQGWWDHQLSDRDIYVLKQHNDRWDVEEMLVIALESGECVRESSLNWVPEQMIRDARLRVEHYVERHPHTARGWQKVGLLWEAEDEEDEGKEEGVVDGHEKKDIFGTNGVGEVIYGVNNMRLSW
ncbi:hypothetical protein C8Q74DRAFT_1282207 [Fomes fomentarius]|nr:hypothetical protein C8Q74DRAFT_1282207 [Fomes fomentarius]